MPNDNFVVVFQIEHKLLMNVHLCHTDKIY